jgi:hypothetical protein
MVQLGDDSDDSDQTYSFSGSLGFQPEGFDADPPEGFGDDYKPVGERSDSAASDDADPSDGPGIDFEDGQDHDFLIGDHPDDETDYGTDLEDKLADKIKDQIQGYLSGDSDAPDDDNSDQPTISAEDLLALDLTPDEVAQYMVDTGMTMADLAEQVPESDLAEYATAYSGITGEVSQDSFADMVAGGDILTLTDAVQDSTYLNQALQMASDGFDDADVDSAYNLAEALSNSGKTQYTVNLRNGRWYVDEV